MYQKQFLNEAVYDQDRLDRYLHQHSRTTGVSRRDVLKALLAGAGALAVGSVPEPRHARATTTPCVLKPTPDDLFIPISGPSGGNWEMRFEAMQGQGYITPTDRFFVRNHTCSAVLDSDPWTLTIDGDGVDNPVTLDYEDILNLGQAQGVTVTRFIECAGNGRGFFDIQDHMPASGGQWHLGAVGVATWTGIPLSVLLDLAEVNPQALDVMPVGLDAEFQSNGHVRRPMPIEKALEDDTLLVYAMNDEPLLPDHGFPARVLVPGWIGVANIKWVGEIQVSTTPLMSPFNTTMYRLFGDAYPPGGELLTTQAVKSAFELPFPATLTAGRQCLTGRAWSGTGNIQQVEVSVDGGPWRLARLHDPNTAEAWVRWSIGWDAQLGDHVLRARATDENGNTQPDDVFFNTLGYLFWAVVDHPVTVI